MTAAVDGHFRVFEYTYKDDAKNTPQIGVMAQEVEDWIPGSVIEIGGVKHVNYTLLLRAVVDCLLHEILTLDYCRSDLEEFLAFLRAQAHDVEMVAEFQLPRIQLQKLLPDLSRIRRRASALILDSRECESAVAGVVHEGEFVFSAPAVRQIGVATLEKMHNDARRKAGEDA